MFNRLYVWEGDNFVGVFTRNPCGVIEFAYDLTAVRPISLSLPLEGGWGEGVPRNFLEGLLPDRDTELIRMKVALGASDTDRSRCSTLTTSRAASLSRRTTNPRHSPPRQSNL